YGLLGYPRTERELCARHRHSTTPPPLCPISTSPTASPSVSSSASSSGLRRTASRSSRGSSARASRHSCSSPPRGSATHVRSGAGWSTEAITVSSCRAERGAAVGGMGGRLVSPEGGEVATDPHRHHHEHPDGERGRRAGGDRHGGPARPARRQR